MDSGGRTVDNPRAGPEAAAVAARVRELMHRQGLTQRALARSGGVSLTVVNDLVNARYGAGTAIGTFEKVAAALGTSLGELFGGPGVSDPDEQLALLRRLVRGDSPAFAELRARLDELAAAFELGPADVDALDAEPALELEQPRVRRGATGDDPRGYGEPERTTLRPQLELLGGTDALQVPLYGHAAAGLGAYNEPVHGAAEVERIPVPRMLRPHDGVLIATRVSGDSMEPELAAGDIVVVHYPELQPALRLLQPGALVAVTTADGGEWFDYVKRVSVDGPTGLKSLASTNPQYAPLPIRPRELRFVGEVKMILKD